MKIALNAGHTKTGPGTGANYKGFNEAAIVRDVAKALKMKLKAKGHTVVDVTVDNATTQNAYLRKVCKLANDSGAELFISLHLNASVSKLGHGVEAYTWRGGQLSKATKICKNIAALGFKNRGVKDGSKLYVIKHTTAKSILVELFFLDNYTDRKLYLEHGAERIAEAIAKSI